MVQDEQKEVNSHKNFCMKYKQFLCWDGTYKGVKQGSGVFVYMIKAKTNCQPEVFRKGTFILIR